MHRDGIFMSLLSHLMTTLVRKRLLGIGTSHTDERYRQPEIQTQYMRTNRLDIHDEVLFIATALGTKSQATPSASQTELAAVSSQTH
jgi:hypothetical protein